jgi:hypothetical protein
VLGWTDQLRLLGILGSSHSSGPLYRNGALAPHPSPPDATQGIVHMHKEPPRGVAWGCEPMYGVVLARYAHPCVR